jgi:Rrf2 family protein
MTLNITSKYALKTVGFMSLRPDDLYSVKHLSDTLDIPYKYLTKIMTKLSKSSIIASIKGRAGGFVLSKNIHELKVKDVLNALEDDSYKLCVLGTGLCNQNKKCQLHDTWKHPKDAVKNDFLEKTFFEINQQETV